MAEEPDNKKNPDQQDPEPKDPDTPQTDPDNQDPAPGNGEPNGEDWKAKYERQKYFSRRWENAFKKLREETQGNQGKPDPKQRSIEERLQALEEENRALRAREARTQLVQKIAGEAKVDANLLARMIGDSEDEIVANADLLKKNLRPPLAKPMPDAATPSPSGPAVEGYDPTKTYPSGRARIMARAADIAARRGGS